MLHVVFDPLFLEHQTGEQHPERPQRLGALLEGIEAGGCPRASWHAAKPATIAQIQSVHSARYVDLVRRFCDGLADGVVAELPTGDTTLGRASFDIALGAAGAAIGAVERAASSGEPAFAVVRPPGHHAEPERGMGFCIFNNVAVAAQFARAQRGAVLVADFDYHHGNGTQAWVDEALATGGGPAIGFVSTHAFPAYPGTGAFQESDVGENGFVVDVPLAHSTGTSDFTAVWTQILPPLADRVKPRTILVSAGFDFLAGDPIAGLPVSQRAVEELCRLLRDVAQGQGAALALVLEGGYALENLRNSGISVAQTLGIERAAGSGGELRTPIGDARLRGMADEIKGWL